MEIKSEFKRCLLPDDIEVRLKDANVFYSQEYFNYTVSRGEKLLYLYSDTYILTVRIKTVLFLSGGILDSEPYCLNSNNPDSEKEFLTACCRYLKSEKIVDWVQSEISSCFLSYPDGATVVGAGNYVLDIANNSEEQLFQKCHSKNRNMIRRGERENIQISRDKSKVIPDYKAVEDQVWKRNNQSGRTLEYYNNLVDKMGDCVSIAVAYKDGIPEAGTLFLYNKTMAYYHHGASKTNPTPGAHNYLMWEQLLYFKKLGVKKVNFVGYRRASEDDTITKSGIKAHDIQRFKERFGGDVVETFSFKFVCSKLKYMMYRLACVVLYKAKFKDAFDIKSKHYPEYNTKR